MSEGFPPGRGGQQGHTEIFIRNFWKDLELQGHAENKNQVPQEIGEEKDQKNGSQGTENGERKFPRNQRDYE